MLVSELVLLIGAMTSLAAVGTTVWKVRRGGPEAQAQMVTASTLLLEQLQQRIQVLEDRIYFLERENAEHEQALLRYTRMYGKFPDLGEK